jgi:hypothetical protein
MAKLPGIDLTRFGAWLAERPPCIQALARRLPPDRLYLLKSSGHRVTLVAYNENGTVRVSVTGQFNALAFDREVFGIPPEDLEECDLPPSDAPLGTVLTEDADVDAFIAAQKVGQN